MPTMELRSAQVLSSHSGAGAHIWQVPTRELAQRCWRPALVSCGLLMMLAGASSAKHTSLRATASSLFAHDVDTPAAPAPAPAVMKKNAAAPSVDWLTPMPTRPMPTTPVPTTHFPTICKDTDGKFPDYCMGDDIPWTRRKALEKQLAEEEKARR